MLVILKEIRLIYQSICHIGDDAIPSGGEGGIRTHGQQITDSSFRDYRTSPLCDLSISTKTVLVL